VECPARGWTARGTRRFACPVVSRHDTFSSGNKDVIRSFKGKLAEMILRDRQVPKGFPTSFAKVARRKLVQLNNAGVLGDVAVPPGNRLEVLIGNFAGKHSIRINDQ
jgi:proteic killer suppression protein